MPYDKPPIVTKGSGGSDSHWHIDPATIAVCRHDDGTPVKLGQGGFGTVYKALQDDVRIVAVKLSDTGEERGKHINAFWREIELIANCRDRNILQFYGAAVNGVRPAAADPSPEVAVVAFGFCNTCI